MARELGKLQPQSSTTHMISNQTRNGSRSISSVFSEGMGRQLLDGRWLAIFYAVVAALCHLTAGLMLGWSNGAFKAAGMQQSLGSNWSISLAATPALMVAVTAVSVHRCYLWIGTKAFLLTAALLATGSIVLEALGESFWCVSASRILAGVSAGIAFTLVPSYVTELNIVPKPLLRDILAAAFPTGILLRFAADWLVPTSPGSIATLWWATIPVCNFLAILLLLPESPRFLCIIGRSSQASTVLQRTNTLESEAPILQSALSRWQDPSPGLLQAVRAQGNFTQLVPLLSLFAFQAFVGVLPMLFYLTNLLELAGLTQAPERDATGLVGVLVTSLLLTRRLLRQAQYHRPLLVASAFVIAGTLFAFGWHCHVRRIRSVTSSEPADWPLVALGLLFAAYGVGFHRLPDALLQAEAHAENLFALRTLAIVVGWGSVYFAVRLLPVLLHNIGLGWLLWNAALVALFAALLVLLAVPGLDEIGHKSLPTVSRLSSTSSSSSSSSSGSTASHCWPRPATPATSAALQIFNIPPAGPHVPNVRPQRSAQIEQV